MSTYTIHCVRGLTKYECPHFQQGEIVCVECPYSRYRLRREEDKHEEGKHESDKKDDD
jgi:hypothetical protein